MKTYGGVDVQIHVFLNSALFGVSSFTPRPLYPPVPVRIGGWVCPRSDLDDVEKRKFLTLPGHELQPLLRSAP
jgi:hypothetical protein